MSTQVRSGWRNGAIDADAEMIGIDQMADALAPLPQAAARIRDLISSLELW